MISSMLSRIFKFLFSKSGEQEESRADNIVEEVANKNRYVSNEIDEEEKLVIALAASIMAGKDKPNSHFHISKITRIDNNCENASSNIGSFEIEEEEKIAIALAASIMAGKDKPNSHFHISKITKINNSYENASLNRADYEIEEENRLVVALAASIMAGKDKPDSHFHISKITKIS